MPKGPIDLVRQVAAILDDLEIPYAVGGSLASTLFGEPRTTMDVDIAVVIAPAQEEGLLARTEAEFYVPTATARQAIREHASFNLLDRLSALKVDLFPLGDGLLDRLQIDRRVNVTLPDPPVDVWFTSPEVQVLRKLDWYRRGGSTSDRQWRDVVGLLQTNPAILATDVDELAESLGLADLLARAVSDARGQPPSP